MSDEPCVLRIAYCVLRNLITDHRSLVTGHRSLVTRRHSPLATRHSPPGPHSSFLIPHSASALVRLLLVVLALGGAAGVAAQTPGTQPLQVQITEPAAGATITGAEVRISLATSGAV